MSKVDLSVFEEFKEALGYEDSLESFVYEMCEGDIGYRNADIFSKYGYVHLEQEGGGEGGAEYCYGVFSLGGKTYKAEYSYYSYHGHDYDYILSTLREVKPVQKVITVYE